MSCAEIPSAANPASCQQTLHALYSDHHGWLHNWLRRKLGNGCDAADLAHDTYLRLITRGAVPRADESRRHLVQIANGLLIDLFRRRRIERAYLETIAQLPEAEVPSPETHALVVEALIAIDTTLGALPAKVRRAFLLSRIERIGYGEIARQLDVSVSSVEKYIARASNTSIAHPGAPRTLIGAVSVSF